MDKPIRIYYNNNIKIKKEKSLSEVIEQDLVKKSLVRAAQSAKCREYSPIPRINIGGVDTSPHNDRHND